MIKGKQMDSQEDYKEVLVGLIEKYNEKNWKWIPSGFKKDMLMLVKLQYLMSVNPSVVQKTNGAIYIEDTVERFTNVKNMMDLNQIFLEVEDKITNPRFFWTLQFNYYPESNMCQSSISKWQSAFTRYDRLTLPLKDRQKCVDENLKVLGGLNPKKINKKVFGYLKNDEKHYIYRGFSVGKNEDIREGRNSINNPHSEVQKNGKGFSYTTREQTAVYFSRQYQVSTVGGVSSFSYGEGMIDQTSMPVQYFNNIDTTLLNKESRRVVAKYEVEKSNILYYHNCFGECEIVSLPGTVKLKHYRFTTVQEFENVIDGDITNNSNAWNTLH